MKALQLEPWIWVITPLGEGRAIIWADPGMDHNSYFLVILSDTGQFKHFDTNDVRCCENPTYSIKRPAFP